jgi:hypothetical protein
MVVTILSRTLHLGNASGAVLWCCCAPYISAPCAEETLRAASAGAAKKIKRLTRAELFSQAELHLYCANVWKGRVAANGWSGWSSQHRVQQAGQSKEDAKLFSDGLELGSTSTAAILRQEISVKLP